jgi:hypothetical protein
MKEQHFLFAALILQLLVSIVLHKSLDLRVHCSYPSLHVLHNNVFAAGACGR